MVVALAGPLYAAVPALAQGHGGHSHGAEGQGGHGDTGDIRAALRLLAAYQAHYRAGHGRYAATLQELGFPRLQGIELRLTSADGHGYAAVSSSPTEECVFFQGSARSPREYATKPNRVSCRALPARGGRGG
jgi:hypothetical protein